MLHVRDLRKHYNGIEALKGITFSVEKGEIYGLLGPNGAGKSTAINIISGILSPTSGSVRVGDADIVSEPIRAKRSLGVVLQDAILVEELSGLQNCLFFGSLYDIPGDRLKKRSLELLSWIGLSDRAGDKVAEYSGGMKRRLSLVLGMLHEPSVMLLDEPTVGLDPQTRLLILDAIAEVASKGTAVLLSTHYLDDAERLCTRLGIIDHGEIIKEGTLESLRRDVKDVQIVTLKGSITKETVDGMLRGIEGGKILIAAEDETVLSIPSRANEVNKLFADVQSLTGVSEISVRPPSLESLFISLTGRRIRE
jgi:ABC-2 type transport system ATP-binding protein